jgi:hypothetical protein
MGASCVGDSLSPFHWGTSGPLRPGPVLQLSFLNHQYIRICRDALSSYCAERIERSHRLTPGYLPDPVGRYPQLPAVESNKTPTPSVLSLLPRYATSSLVIFIDRGLIVVGGFRNKLNTGATRASGNVRHNRDDDGPQNPKKNITLATSYAPDIRLGMRLMFSHCGTLKKRYPTCESGALEPRRVQGRRGPGAGSQSVCARSPSIILVPASVWTAVLLGTS